MRLTYYYNLKPGGLNSTSWYHLILQLIPKVLLLISLILLLNPEWFLLPVDSITITTVYAGKKKFKSYSLGIPKLPTLVKVKPNKLHFTFRNNRYTRPKKFEIDGELPLKVPTIVMEKPDPYAPVREFNINADLKLGQLFGKGDKEGDNGGGYSPKQKPQNSDQIYAAGSDPATNTIPDQQNNGQNTQQNAPPHPEVNSYHPMFDQSIQGVPVNQNQQQQFFEFPANSPPQFPTIPIPPPLSYEMMDPTTGLQMRRSAAPSSGVPLHPYPYSYPPPPPPGVPPHHYLPLPPPGVPPPQHPYLLPPPPPPGGSVLPIPQPSAPSPMLSQFTENSIQKRSSNLMEPYHHHVNLEKPNNPTTTSNKRNPLMQRPPPSPFGPMIPPHPHPPYARPHPQSSMYHFQPQPRPIPHPYYPPPHHFTRNTERSIQLEQQNPTLMPQLSPPPQNIKQIIEYQQNPTNQPPPEGNPMLIDTASVPENPGISDSVPPPPSQPETETPQSIKSTVPMKINIGEHYNPNMMYIDESVVPTLDDTLVHSIADPYGLFASDPSSSSDSASQQNAMLNTNSVDESIPLSQPPQLQLPPTASLIDSDESRPNHAYHHRPYHQNHHGTKYQRQEYPKGYGGYEDDGPDDIRVQFSFSGPHGGKMVPKGTADAMDKYNKQLNKNKDMLPMGLTAKQLSQYYYQHTFTSGLKPIVVRPVRVKKPFFG